MEMVVNNYIMHNLHNDQTDGDLHNDETYFDIEIYRKEHLELKLKSKLKLSNICAYVISHSFLPKRILSRLEDRRQFGG